MAEAAVAGLTFAELNPAAKERARERERAVGPHDEWWDVVYEDAIRVGKLLGFTILPADICFNGFWSQGDGASFMGHYRHPGAPAVAAVTGYAPQDEELGRIAAALDSLQAGAALQHGSTYSAEIVTSGSRYSHSGCMNLHNFGLAVGDGGEDLGDDEDTLCRLTRDFADWIYERLEAEYDHLMSDDSIDQHLDESITLYDEDGDTI